MCVFTCCSICRVMWAVCVFSQPDSSRLSKTHPRLPIQEDKERVCVCVSIDLCASVHILLLNGTVSVFVCVRSV